MVERCFVPTEERGHSAPLSSSLRLQCSAEGSAHRCSSQGVHTRDCSVASQEHCIATEGRPKGMFGLGELRRSISMEGMGFAPAPWVAAISWVPAMGLVDSPAPMGCDVAGGLSRGGRQNGPFRRLSHAAPGGVAMSTLRPVAQQKLRSACSRQVRADGGRLVGAAPRQDMGLAAHPRVPEARQAPWQRPRAASLKRMGLYVCPPHGMRIGVGSTWRGKWRCSRAPRVRPDPKCYRPAAPGALCRLHRFCLWWRPDSRHVFWGEFRRSAQPVRFPLGGVWESGSARWPEKASQGERQLGVHYGIRFTGAQTINSSLEARADQPPLHNSASASHLTRPSTTLATSCVGMH